MGLGGLVRDGDQESGAPVTGEVECRAGGLSLGSALVCQAVPQSLLVSTTMREGCM